MYYIAVYCITMYSSVLCSSVWYYNVL